MSRTFFWAAVLALMAGLAVGWWARGFADRDACLDAGGRWEAGGSYCYAARPFES